MRNRRSRLRVYLNAGFGEPLGADTHEQISALGFTGIRQDIPDDHDAAWAVIQDMKLSTGRPIFLIGGGEMRRGHPKKGGPAWPRKDLLQHVDDTLHKLENTGWFDREFAIEIGNEPEISKTGWDRAQEFTSLVGAAWERVDKVCDGTVISGGVANLNQRGLDFLKGGALFMPQQVHIGIHRYPVGLDENESHIGANRWAENTALKNIIGGKKFWVTETGRSRWHERRTLLWKRTERVPEETVARHLRTELEFWKKARAEALTIYQHRDGPSRTFMDGFGLADVNGNWHPVTAQLKEWIREARFEGHET